MSDESGELTEPMEEVPLPLVMHPEKPSYIDFRLLLLVILLSMYFLLINVCQLSR